MTDALGEKAVVISVPFFRSPKYLFAINFNLMSVCLFLALLYGFLTNLMQSSNTFILLLILLEIVIRLQSDNNFLLKNPLLNPEQKFVMFLLKEPHRIPFLVSSAYLLFVVERFSLTPGTTQYISLLKG